MKNIYDKKYTDTKGKICRVDISLYLILKNYKSLGFNSGRSLSKFIANKLKIDGFTPYEGVK